MLGNDVVDLFDPDSRPESHPARFDERVFTPDEQRAIARDANPLARRWAHWGAKEAAFKLAKQIAPEFIYAPKRLVVRYLPATIGPDARATRSGTLELPRIPGNPIRRLEIRSHESPERIHVIAAPEGTDWKAIDSGVDRLGPTETDPSRAVRWLAIRRSSRILGIARDRLTIGRRGRIPVLELDGSTTSFCLSLSHHGRWIACAMRPRIDFERDSAPARWPGTRSASHEAHPIRAFPGRAPS